MSFAPKTFTYVLIDDEDGTVNQTGAQSVCGDYSWSIDWCLTGSLPTDEYIVEVEYSNDGVKWDLFSSCSVIENQAQGAFFFHTLPFLNIRIKYTATNVQAGSTIFARLVLKK